MSMDTPAYGLWPLVAINAAVFIICAFSFTHPHTSRGWRSFGAFAGFLVALFTEMYGFPLTLYLPSSWLGSRYPGLDIFSHEAGHLWQTLLGWKGDPHFDPLYRVGRPEWAGELGLSFSSSLRRGLDDAEARGESVIALMDAKQVLALFALADQVRSSAKTAVARLQLMHITPVMVTGDAEAVARTVAKELGVERYYARVLPQDRAKILRELKSQGQTAFVGDGINDAPALQEADLGVAIGAGTDVAIESADLVLVESNPLDVVAALTLSRATYHRMGQNLRWATGYNAVSLPLAAGVAYAWGVLLSPAVGAIFVSASTVIVALNAMLLRRLRFDG
jgi:cation transport ATPase